MGLKYAQINYDIWQVNRIRLMLKIDIECKRLRIMTKSQTCTSYALSETPIYIVHIVFLEFF